MGWIQREVIKAGDGNYHDHDELTMGKYESLTFKNFNSSSTCPKYKKNFFGRQHVLRTINSIFKISLFTNLNTYYK